MMKSLKHRKGYQGFYRKKVLWSNANITEDTEVKNNQTVIYENKILKISV